MNYDALFAPDAVIPNTMAPKMPVLMRTAFENGLVHENVQTMRKGMANRGGWVSCANVYFCNCSVTAFQSAPTIITNSEVIRA